MKIAVCVKQVPDTWAEKKLDDADKTLDRESADGVMNELDEYAVEEALLLTEAQGGEVVAVSMGPAKAEETVRKALQMGADSGVDAGQVGLAAAWSQVAEFANRPPKAAGVKVEDDGSGGVKIAEYLSEQKFI